MYACVCVWSSFYCCFSIEEMFESSLMTVSTGRFCTQYSSVLLFYYFVFYFLDEELHKPILPFCLFKNTTRLRWKPKIVIYCKTWTKDELKKIINNQRKIYTSKYFYIALLLSGFIILRYCVYVSVLYLTFKQKKNVFFLPLLLLLQR